MRCGGPTMGSSMGIIGKSLKRKRERESMLETVKSVVQAQARSAANVQEILDFSSAERGQFIKQL